ncbi:amino acid ABC transporter permease [Phreatobacter stygius]|uniref:Amino acid ABC transporter permease n=1 Tax=Phreatobacter stygius TaxID=1940610 RepID=A0A4D7B5N4_9HYPH|nr:amino acid ABC transporter permease [Phreatobacter stygius]QCI66293.1 amino acid ABC transporter permease [Phreatobacter stygius]
MPSDWDRFLATFFDPEIAARYFPAILGGVAVTVLIGIAVIVTGITAGLGLAVLRSLGKRPLTFAIIVFVDIFRALPPLVLILLIYFGLPNIGIVLPNFIVLWLSLAAVLAAFAEEVFWAGITSVPSGQWMAARSTGLTFGQTLGSVVLPQAVRLAIPPLTNKTISITKNTALGSAIGVSEILGRSMSAQAFSGNATPLMIGAALYIVVFFPLVVASRWLERRYGWRRA